MIINLDLRLERMLSNQLILIKMFNLFCREQQEIFGSITKFEDAIG